MDKVYRHAVAYIRVSKHNGHQDPANQLPDIRRYAAEHGFDLLEVYEDRISGRRADRPALRKLFLDAKAGIAGRRPKFECVITWAIDRFSRQGIFETFKNIHELGSCGVRVASVQEPWIDPTRGDYELVLALCAYIARQEAERLSSRIRAGLARARSLNIPLGRPRVEVDVPALVAAYGQTPSIRIVAQRFHLSRSLVHKVLKEHRRSVGTEPELRLNRA